MGLNLEALRWVTWLPKRHQTDLTWLVRVVALPRGWLLGLTDQWWGSTPSRYVAVPPVTRSSFDSTAVVLLAWVLSGGTTVPASCPLSGYAAQEQVLVWEQREAVCQYCLLLARTLAHYCG